MTGWAQVNGLRGDTSLERRIKFDLYYIENWSWIDSLFFSVSYITTAGHATMVPLTDIGKLFTSAYLLVGVSLALYILIDVLGKHTDTMLTQLGKKVIGKKVN